MTVEDDLLQLQTLCHVGIALVQFTRGIQKGEFRKRGKQWVFDINFVTFSIHHEKTENITLSLYGRFYEFLKCKELFLGPGRGVGYSRCCITEPQQLGSACYYIKRARELWLRGRTRKHLTHVLTEVRN